MLAGTDRTEVSRHAYFCLLYSCISDCAVVFLYLFEYMQKCKYTLAFICVYIVNVYAHSFIRRWCRTFWLSVRTFHGSRHKTQKPCALKANIDGEKQFCSVDERVRRTGGAWGSSINLSLDSERSMFKRFLIIEIYLQNNRVITTFREFLQLIVMAYLLPHCDDFLIFLRFAANCHNFISLEKTSRRVPYK